MLALIGRCRDGQGRKCDKDGMMRLVDPDGMVVPGCHMCREHAEECVREYASKIGQHWTMIDVRTDERIDIVSESLLEKLKAPIDPLEEALDALRGLYDLQNGPPLIKDQRAWESAMLNACDVLSKHNR